VGVRKHNDFNSLRRGGVSPPSATAQHDASKAYDEIPNRVGRENLPPLAATLCAQGIRPHPLRTWRKEAACACGWLKLTASCRQRNEKWQLKLKNCRAWSERAAAALAKATTAAEFLEAREQADIAYNAAKLAARAGNRASAKEERTALTMSEPAINAGM
jgi:hypothetical protein